MFLVLPMSHTTMTFFKNKQLLMNGGFCSLMVLYGCRATVRMMTSSNGNIFRVTGPLCGEFTGTGDFPAQRPETRSFDVFFDLRLKKRLSKQPWGWWFEMPSWSLWRRCNGITQTYNPGWKGWGHSPLPGIVSLWYPKKRRGAYNRGCPGRYNKTLHKGPGLLGNLYVKIHVS